MNSINAKNLREFLYLANAGSITSAAQGLYITPQGLSKTIKNLEEEIGAPLFTRSSAGVELTPAGKALKEDAIALLEILDGIGKKSNYANGTSVNNKKTIKMDFTFGTIKFFTLNDMHRFESTHSNVKLFINEATDSEIFAHIMNGDADIGFCVGPVDGVKFEAVYLYSRRHCIVVNKENKLAKMKSVTWKDLKDEPIIFEGKEFSAYNNNLNRCLKAGFQPNIVFCAGDVTFAHQLAAEGAGIAISVEDMAEKINLDNVVVIPFSDNDCSMDVYMISQKNKIQREEITELIEHIKTFRSKE